MRMGLDKVSVNFGRRSALTDVTLDLARGGRIVGLFGPNGAGKTTALRVMAGVIQRFKGRRVLPKGETVAFLPDCAYLYPWLRLGEAVDVFAARWPDFRSEVAMEILNTLGLSVKMRVRECSRGMSEQVHIALTLARAPGLYAFDEPLASVDPATRRLVLGLISQYRALDSTLLMSTHLIESVAGIFDDIVIINGGQVVLDTTVDEATGGGCMQVEDVYLNFVGAGC
jgi:ABC-2 type transport system ATP-binding protein